MTVKRGDRQKLTIHVKSDHFIQNNKLLNVISLVHYILSRIAEKSAEVLYGIKNYCQAKMGGCDTEKLVRSVTSEGWHSCDRQSCRDHTIQFMSHSIYRTAAFDK